MAKSIIYLVSLVLSLTLTAQNVDFENSILVTAGIEGDALLLQWPSQPNITTYFIKKREKGQTSYKPLVSLSGSATSYLDTNVVKGKIYEYHITRQNATTSTAVPIAAGIEVAPAHIRGGVLLVIESGIASSLSNEIMQFSRDLTDEGWGVEKLEVDASSAAADVKQAIKNKILATAFGIRTLVLIGKVPVPYSGYLAPDGHTPDHLGAWPADVYYGDLDGTWTDNQINATEASGSRNDNVPGDGKFDPSSLPGKVELEVGRIDLSDLPAFPKNEVELLKQYFQKNHDFRRGNTPYVRRALIQNNFGSYAEAFGQSGLNNYCRFFGKDSVFYLPYKSTLQQSSYLCSYGCGAGHYQGASGIGTTGELVNENHKTVFTMLFGSYFGDWHNTNNYLRAALASGQVLTNCWAGRPVWHIHHMAVGETIGYGTRLSQNNSSELNAGFGATGVHVALMGDPTLGLLPFNPGFVHEYQVVKDTVKLFWESLDDSYDSLFVYRKLVGEPFFDLIATLSKKSKNFTDLCRHPGQYEYLLRPMRIEKTGSGSFQNLGNGDSFQVEVDYNGDPILMVDAEVSYDLFQYTANVINGALTQITDGTQVFDIGTSLLFEKEGEINLCFRAENQCFLKDTCITFTVTSSLPDLEEQIHPGLCPDSTGSVELVVLKEKLPYTIRWSRGDSTLIVDNLAAGEYFCTITTSTGRTQTYGPFTIEIPEPLYIVLKIQPSDAGTDNGSIEIEEITGGTAPYQISINGGVFTETDTFAQLAPGDYLLQIRDQNGCFKDTTVTISRLSSTQDGEDTKLMYIDEDGIWHAIEPGLSLEVFDVNGKLAISGSFDTARSFLENKALPCGMYLVHAHKSKKQQWMLRMVCR